MHVPVGTNVTRRNVNRLRDSNSTQRPHPTYQAGKSIIRYKMSIGGLVQPHYYLYSDY